LRTVFFEVCEIFFYFWVGIVVWKVSVYFTVERNHLAAEPSIEFWSKCSGYAVSGVYYDLWSVGISTMLSIF
jgi:hypothetical protein